MPDTSILVPSLLASEQSILVIVDIQQRLLSAMPDVAAHQMTTNTIRLLASADSLSVPVLLSEQYPKGLGATHPDVIAALPEGARRFEKTAFSCFRAPGFVPVLRALIRPQVVLVGQETHVCVLQTALDLLSAGFQVFVVEDAVCSRSASHKNNALDRMRQAGAIVINYESVIFEWLGDARHPDFKTLSALVK